MENFEQVMEIFHRQQHDIRQLFTTQEKLLRLLQKKREESPALVDAQTLCRILNIKRRTLYDYIRKYNIPEHRKGTKPLYLLEEVRKCLTKTDKI